MSGLAAFERLPRSLRAVLLVIVGAAAGLGQAPWDVWWLSLLAFAAVLLMVPVKSQPRRAFAAAWLVGFGYFGLTLHWIVEPFLVDRTETGWMAPFALVLMAGGAALFWAVAGWLAAALRAGSAGLVLTLTLTEAARALILTGFPWALIGHVWITTPLAQVAQYIGPHGLTLITLSVAWCLAALVARRWWAAAGPLVAVLAWEIVTPEAAGPNDGPVVRLVQPNVPQSEKWNPDAWQQNYSRMVTLTGQPPGPPALIVLPETAIPFLLDMAQPNLDQLSEAAQGAPLVLGINRRDGQRYYNSFVMLGRGGTVDRIYDKAHLTPFGEYVPGGEWLSRFGISTLAPSHGGGFSTGGIQPLIEIPGVGAARALICYEGIFAEEIGTAERPRLMVLITNDAWFGPAAGPKQHLAQARLRAIEQGLPMVRVANTGISAMIDPRGRIVDSLPLGTAGALDVQLPDALPAPLYTRIGDLPVILGAFLSLLILAVRSRVFGD